MSVTVTAPAKINLYLHITGKRDDGYHLLDSLSAPLPGIADVITVSSAEAFSLNITGPFAPMINGDAADSNLVSRAAKAIADYAGRAPHLTITLEKNIPPGAGLGGGSSDAAATARALMTLWNMPADDAGIIAALTPLGADIPACYANAPMVMRGIGDVLSPAPALPDLPMVVIYPGVPSPTPLAYKNFKGPFRDNAAMPGSFTAADDVIAFLTAQENSLTDAAIHTVPAIQDALNILNAQDDIRLARMTGSGSACFGIFGSNAAADAASDMISRSAPSIWWVRRGGLSIPR